MVLLWSNCLQEVMDYFVEGYDFRRIPRHVLRESTQKQMEVSKFCVLDKPLFFPFGGVKLREAIGVKLMVIKRTHGCSSLTVSSKSARLTTISSTASLASA